MDRYAFCAPARVKALLVPVCGSSSTAFDSSVRLVRACLEVRLLDISPYPELRLFDPETFPSGKLLLDFNTDFSDPQSFFLHDFEPFRKTFIVLGLAQYSDDNGSNSLKLALEHLRSQYPSSICHAIVAFGLSEPSPSSTSSGIFYNSGSFASLPTIVCDICRMFLALLDTYASSYPNITLRSPVSMTDSHALVSQSILRAQKSLSSGSSSFSASFKQAPSASSTPPGIVSPATPAQSLSPAPDPKSRAKLRQAGRQAKLMGNFFLLSGHYSKALQSFLDSLVHLKKSDDSLWLASALESVGVCMILLQASNTHFNVPVQIFASVLQVSKQKVSSFVSSMAELLRSPMASLDHTTPSSARSSLSINHRSSATLNQQGASPRTSIGSMFSPSDSNSLQSNECILLISSRSQALYQQSASDYDNIVPDVVYIESILRSISFLLYSTPQILPNPNTREVLRRIDHISSMKLSALSIEIQCRVYCALATIYSELGMFRKRGFILRALLIALMAHLDIETAEGPLTMAEELPIQIKPVFESLLDLYGLGSTPESDAHAAYNHAQGGWTTIQVHLLKIFIKFLDSTKDYESLLKICSLLLVRLSHCLTVIDQNKVKDKVDAILHFSALNNLKLSTPYWDPFLLREILIIPLRNQDTTVIKQDLADKTLVSNLDVFDPYNRPKNEGPGKEKMLVQGQVQVLRLVMQNPFLFDVEIHSIEVATDPNSVKIETIADSWRKVVPDPGASEASKNRRPDPRNPSTTPTISQASSTFSLQGPLTLTKNSIETVTVSIKPLEAGELTVIGIHAQVERCEKQLFHIIDQEIRHSGIKRVPANKNESNLNTMDMLHNNLRTNTVNDRATLTALDLTVIPRQPTLVVSKTLIIDGCCMILEGQRFQFSVEFVNVSTEIINYLSFSFWDSGVDFYVKRLKSSALLPPNEVHELEWQMLKNKTFSVLNKLDISNNHKIVAPSDSICIEFEVVGKRLVKDLRIVLDYGNRSENNSQEYSKQVHFPLAMTVMPSIEIVAYNIMPLSHGFTVSNDTLTGPIGRVREYFANETRAKAMSSYCLLEIDMKNSHWNNLDAHLDYKAGLEDEFSIDLNLGPGETTRVFVPMRRIAASDIDVSKPIPSLRNKQFIKNSFMTEGQVSAMLEQFWIRHKLLKHLKGSWNCARGDRMGIIDFRSLRVSAAFSKTLLCDNIEFDLHIFKDDDPSTPLPKCDAHVHLKKDTFYVLSCTINNLSAQTARGTIRHVPLSIAACGPGPNAPQPIDGKVLVNGVLQYPIDKGGIEPHSSVTIQLSFVILERGEYEWGLIFDQTDPTNGTHVSREPLMITAT